MLSNIYIVHSCTEAWLKFHVIIKRYTEMYRERNNAIKLHFTISKVREVTNVSACILAMVRPIDAIEPPFCVVKSGESADTNNSIPQKKKGKWTVFLRQGHIFNTVHFYGREGW